MSSEGTPLHGDRGAWDVMNFDDEHARDIMDATLRRHLPLPGLDAGYPRSDGADWQRTQGIPLPDLQNYTAGFIVVGGAANWEAAAFDWDTLSAGVGADMVHSHASNAEGGTISHDNALSNVSADDHHSEVHVVNSTGPHAEAGLTAGHVLRATGVDTFAFAALMAGDIPTNLTLSGLVVTGGTAPLIDLNPSFTDTGCVLDITPSAAIDTIDARWKGICIDGAALDPSVVDVDLHGLHVDFSGIDTTNLPHIDAVHIETPVGYHQESNHALHLSGGGIWQDWDGSGATGVDTFTVHNVVIDIGAATAGMIHSYDVAVIGSGSVLVAALGTHAGVDPIHQHIGTFVVTAKAWEENGGFSDATAAFGNDAVNVEIFSADDDYIYISGNTAGSSFSEIQVLLTVNAAKSIKPVFEFSTGGPGWTPFYPADDTNGFQHDGLIRFSAANLITAGWAVQDVNAEGQTRFWVRIQRTRNNLGTAPTEKTIKVLVPTPYHWDKDGDVRVASVTVAGSVIVGTTDAPSELFQVHDGQMGFSDSDVTQPMTDLAATNVYGLLRPNHTTIGGLRLTGLTDDDEVALYLRGVIGSVDPLDIIPAIAFAGGKWDGGTSWEALADAETVFELRNYTTALVTVLGSGNVGIGTDAPSGLFQVHNGEIAFSDSDVNQPMTDIAAANVYAFFEPEGATTGGLRITGLTDFDNEAVYLRGIHGIASPTFPAVSLVGGKTDGGTGWQALAADEIVFRLRNHATSLITVLGDGKVGIGAVSPSALLDLVVAHHQFIELDRTAHGSVDNLFYAGVSFSGVGDDFLWLGRSTSNFVVTKDAKVGIGTTAPSQLLTLEGSGGASRLFMEDTGESFPRIAGTGGRIGVDHFLFMLQALWDGNEVAEILFETGDDTTNKDDGRITFRTSEAGGNPVEWMRIDPDGSVGIATVSPRKALEVVGDLRVAATDGSAVYMDINEKTIVGGLNATLTINALPNAAEEGIDFQILGGSKVFIRRDGNVGIGRTAPQGLLHGYDAISGFLHWEYDGVDGDVQTIIPEGAGDVLYAVGGMKQIRASDGDLLGGHISSAGVAPGGSVALYDVGGETLTLAVAADGSVTVQRTAGTLTYKVGLWLLWL